MDDQDNETVIASAEDFVCLRAVGGEVLALATLLRLILKLVLSRKQRDPSVKMKEWNEGKGVIL
jgi:hypothetical protein